MAKITSDVSEIQSSYLSILELVVREPLTIIFSVFAMLFFSFKLTLFVLIFIPICGVIISNLGKKLKKKSFILNLGDGKRAKTLKFIRL